MLEGSIPSWFVEEKTSLSLVDLRWALDNGVIGAQIAVDVAKRMTHAGDVGAIVNELASVTHAELPDVQAILSKVTVNDERAESARRKWVWLVLSWLYEHHRADADVFDKIDSLYADFGYPQEIAAFGPYAPAYQTRGDPTEQRNRVLSEWRQYLLQGEKIFGRSS